MPGQTARAAGVTFLITLLLLMAGGLLVMYSGAYNVAAMEERSALGRWILETGQEWVSGRARR